jgi:hypothetical protein
VALNDVAAMQDFVLRGGLVKALLLVVTVIGDPEMRTLVRIVLDGAGHRFVESKGYQTGMRCVCFTSCKSASSCAYRVWLHEILQGVDVWTH